jgi:hypothetical protein
MLTLLHCICIIENEGVSSALFDGIVCKLINKNSIYREQNREKIKQCTVKIEILNSYYFFLFFF